MASAFSPIASRNLFLVFVVFFVSVVFSFRGITSISIGLILLVSLIENRRNLFTKEILSLFFIGCTLLFLTRCFSLLQTQNTSQGLILLQRSSGLVIIPLAVSSCKRFLSAKRYSQLMVCFVLILFSASLFCLFVNTIKFLNGSSATIFFYHDLVKPIHQHAIQFSILVFIALTFLFHLLTKTTKYKTITYISITYFSFLLLLLSSKLVLFFYLLLIFYFLFRFFPKLSNPKKVAIVSLPAVAVLVSLLLLTPLKNRFSDIFSGNQELFKQEKFDPGTYFNGIQFRLLQWRFVYEILNEEQGWIKGVSPGDAQSYLDKKYISTNMYQGEAGTSNRGYLGFHTHNEFLQVLLETGLIGLFFLILICFSLIRMAFKKRDPGLSFLVLLLLVYSFTDAVLETQYGLLIFCFFPLFMYAAGKEGEHSGH